MSHRLLAAPALLNLVVQETGIIKQLFNPFMLQHDVDLHAD